MTKKEKRDLILEAKEKLEEVYDLLRPLGREDSHFQRCWLDKLAILTTSDHGFLTRDYNLDEAIEDLEEEEEEEQSEE